MARIDKITCFLLILLIQACGHRKSGTETSLQNGVITDSANVIVADEPAEDPYERGITELITAFTTALISGENTDLEKYYANVSVARKLAPDATRDKSDKTIYAEMIVPLYEKLESDLNAIRTAMNVHAVEPASFIFKNFEIDPGSFATVPMAMSIKYEWNSNLISIPVTIARVGNDLYIFEILKTTGLFD